MKGQIEAFLRHLTVEKRFSENTAAAYKNDLSQMADFFQEKGTKQWPDVDHQLVLNYLLNLKQRGYAPATIARKTASAKTMFKYLENAGVIKSTPTENVGAPRVKKSVPQPLSETEVRDLLRQPDKYPTPEARRDKAMLELLYASGMQISELMSLNVHDVTMQDSSVTCLIRGSKERNTCLSRGHVPSLKKYLDEARPQLLHQRGEEALFLNRLGQRLTRQGLWQIVKIYAKEAKLNNQITLRALRHSLIAAASQKTKS